MESDENVIKINKLKKKYDISISTCLITFALIIIQISFIGQIDRNTGGGYLLFITSFIYIIFGFSFFIATIYCIKWRLAQNKIKPPDKKKNTGLYWTSLIWVAFIIQIAGKTESKLSTVLIMAFLPVAGLWAIVIIWKFFKQRKVGKTDWGLIIWANLVFWGYVGIRLLHSVGM